MIIFKKALAYIKNKRRKHIDKDTYIIKNKKNTKWAFVSYIPSVFYDSDNSRKKIHQNQNEMIKIAETFEKLGLNVYILSYYSNKELPEIDVTIVFGLEPVFERACTKYTNAKKIYYATGAYYLHQNQMVTSMTNNFNKTYNAHIPYKRLVPPHNSCEIADKILQIGSIFTIGTYPSHLQSKIITIHQSTQSKEINTNNIEYAEENEFVFMGSYGNTLRGIGLLVEYFCKNTDHTFHIIGPMEDDVMKAIQQIITPNIIIHGFLDIDGIELHNILKRCNYLIYPSGSEGGCPGSVLNLMKKGMIPIVTRWAAFDEIIEYGYLLKSINYEAIQDAVLWTLGLKKNRIVEMKKNAAKYVNEKYTIATFSNELKVFMSNILLN